MELPEFNLKDLLEADREKYTPQSCCVDLTSEMLKADGLEITGIVKLPSKPKTNRDRFFTASVYDILLQAHKTLAKRQTTCILEALDENLVCTGNQDSCEECIARWLNAPIF